ncbi:MAG TPA: hypothetical protein VG452_11320 [Egibacteraceae bacterium]|nr:hypothetical protein [Actinomycetota bacterium]HWB72797.1 hypothetical protein [Egibacteraceae bacterium]
MARQDDTVEQAQNQFLDNVRQSQEAFAKAVQTWSDSVTKLVPDLSSLPLSDQYLDPRRAVDSAFAFAEQLLNTQRQFAHDVVSALVPAVEAAEATQEKATPSRAGSKS